MDLSVAIVSGLLGAGGIIGFIQFLISRHDNKVGRLIRIESKLDQVDQKCIRNELATTKLQLFFLMETQPDNEDAIEVTAQRYFIELDGNAEAWAPFYKWATEHKVDTGWYKALLERERRRNNVQRD